MISRRAVAIDVSHIGAHPGQRPALGAHRDSGPKTNLFENSLPLVMEKKVGYGIIGDVDIRQSVVIVVPKDDTESVAVRAVNIGLFRDIGKGTIAVVVIQDAGKRWYTLG
jgi:hypothetical protein